MTVDGNRHPWLSRPDGHKRQGHAMRDAARRMYDVLEAYQHWEADLILGGDWSGELPRLTRAQFARLLELQAERNAALAKARGEA